MFYIPDDWIKNKKNENRIHELLACFGCDLITDDILLKQEKARAELATLGEDTILKKLDDGTIQSLAAG